jgi:hypothetical protein
MDSNISGNYFSNIKNVIKFKSNNENLRKLNAFKRKGFKSFENFYYWLCFHYKKVLNFLQNVLKLKKFFKKYLNFLIMKRQYFITKIKLFFKNSWKLKFEKTLELQNNRQNIIDFKAFILWIIYDFKGFLNLFLLFKKFHCFDWSLKFLKFAEIFS